MEIDQNNLHHAYFFLGDEKEAENLIGSLFVKLEINSSGNPDIHTYTERTFGIDEARILKQRADSKAFGSKKFFIIFSELITNEAQNALLKVFEEPTPDTHFIIVSSKNILLPTLLSRLKTIRLDKTENSTDKKADEFLSLDVSERVVFIKKELADDSFNLSDFLDNLMKKLSGDNKNLNEIRKVFNLAKFSSDAAANSRLILEHLAFSLPERLK